MAPACSESLNPPSNGFRSTEGCGSAGDFKEKIPFQRVEVHRRMWRRPARDIGGGRAGEEEAEEEEEEKEEEEEAAGSKGKI